MPSKGMLTNGKPPESAHAAADVENAVLLHVDGLAKSYPGFSLEDISFDIRAGRITGFIGRNGAGKSTTLKCLEGSVHPDRGAIEYFGRPYSGNEDAVKIRTGFELGEAGFYRTKRLALIADVTRSFYPNWSQDAYQDYCRLFDLDQRKCIMDLSQGMRVKFALALALSHQPKLLICDEPTSGLDPASREEVLDILLGLAREKHAGVLFSTHITSDLDKCADDILYLRDGRLVGQGPLSDFKARYAAAPLDMVQARVATMVMIEIVMLVVMALFVLLREPLGINSLAADQDVVGTAANFYLIGFGFVVFGLFDLVFYPLYYRNPLKVGAPFIIACIPACIAIVSIEALPYIPASGFAAFGVPGFADIPVQAAVLVFGIAAFAACSALAVWLSVRSFATFDA